MLLVPEPGRVGSMDLSSGGLETENGSPFLSTFRERVAARACYLAQTKGLLTGLREGHQGRTAETDVAPPPHDDRAQHPAFGPAGGHEQVQSAAVCDPPGSCVSLRRLHGPRGERLLWVPTAF